MNNTLKLSLIVGLLMGVILSVPAQARYGQICSDAEVQTTNRTLEQGEYDGIELDRVHEKRQLIAGERTDVALVVKKNDRIVHNLTLRQLADRPGVSCAVEETTREYLQAVSKRVGNQMGTATVRTGLTKETLRTGVRAMAQNADGALRITLGHQFGGLIDRRGISLPDYTATVQTLALRKDEAVVSFKDGNYEYVIKRTP